MESILSKIEKNDLREFLVKGWMTHDAMWLYHCYEECGMEKTNRINKAAVKSMSAIEIKRVMKTLGFPKDYKVETFEELMDIVTGAFDLVRGDFMKFSFTAPEKNILKWEWERGKCFAYEGTSSLGVVEDYDCAIMTRIETWLQGLNIDYTMTPKINGCLMHKTGKCEGDFHFNLA